MRHILYLIAFLIFNSFFSQGVVGIWETVNEKTGKAESHVKIYEKEGKYYGEIIKILDPKDADNLCTECSGSFKNKKIKGMRIMWGFSKESKTKYENGKILDPNDGDIYSCNLKLENANKLKVRGYIGISLIGRSQYWNRINQKI